MSCGCEDLPGDLTQRSARPREMFARNRPCFLLPPKPAIDADSQLKQLRVHGGYDSRLAAFLWTWREPHRARAYLFEVIAPGHVTTAAFATFANSGAAAYNDGRRATDESSDSASACADTTCSNIAARSRRPRHNCHVHGRSSLAAV